MVAHQPRAILARSSSLSQPFGENSQRPSPRVQGAGHRVSVDPLRGARNNRDAFTCTMFADPARELAILIRPVARPHYGEAATIEHALRTDTIEERRGCLPEVPFETFGITAVATADHPQTASFPPFDDQGKGRAAFQQRRNAIRIDLCRL